MDGTFSFRRSSSRYVVLTAFAIRCLLAGFSSIALSQTSDEEVWQGFLRWIPSAQPSRGPRGLFNQYQKQLVAEGLSPSEADRQVAVIRKLRSTRTDGQPLIFNNVYSHSKPAFSTKPNALLMSIVEGRTPGRALDVGMGQGRNSVFLAMRGWDTTGFDVSDKGLAVAVQGAEAAGVKVNAVLDSIEKFDYGRDRWDLIAIMYEPAPVTEPDYVRRLGNALRPGGLVVIEHAAADWGPAETRSGTATSERDNTIDPTLLRRAFDGFRILYFEDTVAIPDWGFRKRKTRLVRFVAEKRKQVE